MTAATLRRGLVFTYHPDGRAIGLITGAPDEDGGLVVEHVVTFPEAPAGTLTRMFAEALEVCREHAWRYILVRIDIDRPALAALAARLGFWAYKDDFWVLYL